MAHLRGKWIFTPGICGSSEARLLLESFSWMGAGASHSQKQILLCPGVMRLQQEELRLGTTLQPAPSPANSHIPAPLCWQQDEHRFSLQSHPTGNPCIMQLRRGNISVYSTAHWKLILDELSAQQYMVFLPQVRCILPWFKYHPVLLFSSRGSGLINPRLTPQPKLTIWLHPNNYSWIDCTLSWEPTPIKGSVGQNKKPLSAPFSPH